MNAPLRDSAIRLSADVGGTFTDVAAFDEKTGALRLGKTLTTPERLVTGIENGVGKAGSRFNAAGLFLHGTTVAINTILERKGARCALLTTQGFRDIYEIGRVNRPESYNLFFEKHAPLIDRDMRFEIMERMDAQGAVLIPLDEEQVLQIRTRGGRSRRAGHRHPVPALLPQPGARDPRQGDRAEGIPAALRHRLARAAARNTASTSAPRPPRPTPISARACRPISPKCRPHLGDAGFGGNFLIVQSTGGLFDVDDARRSCIRMLESGPAAGVVGTKVLCDSIGLANAIAFDMGGTTAKAGVIYEGTVLMTGSALIGGYATGLPVQMPMIDIQEVGTGGGSIARVEVGNALRVGPESAGAAPGPVCYGLGGTEPTITDANLILGRLGADRFLGGEMPLDLPAAKKALTEKVAKPLGIDPIEAAEGILRIATTKMAHVVRWVTTERGLDAADFALVAYGGAGPLHAAAVARELSIGTVIIPRAPGHFSACGMLVADLRRDFVNTWFKPLAEASFADMEAIFAEMERQGRETVGRGQSLSGVEVRRSADMRYVGQEHAVTVELPIGLFKTEDRAGIKALFDAVHQTRYGFSVANEKAEIVSLRSAVVGQLAQAAVRAHREGKCRAGRRGVPRQAAGVFRQHRLCRHAHV